MRDAVLEKDLQMYYMQVRHLLVGSRNQRNKMMQAMAGDVDAFLENNPAADMNAVVKRFGTVQEVGDSMVAGMEPRELRRYVRRINAWNWFVAVFMIVTIVVMLSMQVQKILFAMAQADQGVVGPPTNISETKLPDDNVINQLP